MTEEITKFCIQGKGTDILECNYKFYPKWNSMIYFMIFFVFIYFFVPYSIYFIRFIVYFKISKANTICEALTNFFATYIFFCHKPKKDNKVKPLNLNMFLEYSRKSSIRTQNDDSEYYRDDEVLIEEKAKLNSRNNIPNKGARKGTKRKSHKSNRSFLPEFTPKNKEISRNNFSR